MLRKRRIVYAVFLGFVLFVSCGKSNYIVNENTLIENEEWLANNQLPVYFSITDTQMVYKIGFNIRYTSDYPKQNMYIFLHTLFPDGMRAHDTVSVNLFSPMGEPFGKGKRVKELQVDFSYVKFPMAGNYTMNIEQAMRMDTLPGVVSMGLYVIEPTE